MTVRALIIAIEEYPMARDLGSTLAGTNTAADDFRSWLIEEKFAGRDPGQPDLQYCGQLGRAGVTAGTSKADVKSALVRLFKAPQGTSELYVFFSGHGFSYEEHPSATLPDVLVCSNWVERTESGDACVVFPVLRDKLQMTLGPGEHFYFIDACRNVIGQLEVEPTGLGVTPPRAQNGDACAMTLFSTEPAARAATQSGFAAALVAGLRGAGRAKAVMNDTAPPRVVVDLGSLQRYLKSRLRQSPRVYNPEQCPGILCVLGPTSGRPLLTVEVGADPSADGDPGRGTPPALLVRLQRPDGFADELQGAGSHLERRVFPGRYRVTLTVDGQPALLTSGPGARPGPVPDDLELWDDTTLGFTRPPRAVPPAWSGAAPGGAPPGGLVDGGGEHTFSETLEGLPAVGGSSQPACTLEVRDTPGVRVFDLASGQALDRPGRLDVAPGSYRVESWAEGQLLASEELELQAGDQRSLRLRPRSSPAREGILRQSGNDPQGVAFVVSESLGPFSDARLGLLLSLLGANGVLRDPDNFLSQRFPRLHRFDAPLEGAAELSVLVAGEPHGGSPRLELGGTPLLVDGPIDGVPGLWQARLQVSPGAHLLAARVPGRLPLTLATFALAGRVTLVTLNVDEESGAPEVHQYLLAPKASWSDLHPEEREVLVHGSPTRFVRYLWRVQRWFEERRAVERLSEGQDAALWESVLRGNGTDPILGVLAVHELLRRGGGPRGAARAALQNLERFYSELPDVQILAGLASDHWPPLPSPPLLRASVLSVPDGVALPLPLPEERLLGAGLFTAWRG